MFHLVSFGALCRLTRTTAGPDSSKLCELVGDENSRRVVTIDVGGGWQIAPVDSYSLMTLRFGIGLGLGKGTAGSKFAEREHADCDGQ